jgi:hypothetical protein
LRAIITKNGMAMDTPTAKKAKTFISTVELSPSPMSLTHLAATGFMKKHGPWIEYLNTSKPNAANILNPVWLIPY